MVTSVVRVGCLALLLTAAATACGGSSTAPTPAASSGGAVSSGTLLQQQYNSFRSEFESREASFDTAVANAANSGNYSQLPVFANSEAPNLQYFDGYVRSLTFPAAAKSDVAAMLTADATLSADVLALVE